MIENYKKLHGLAIKCESMEQKMLLIERIYDILKEAESTHFHINWFHSHGNKEKFLKTFDEKPKQLYLMPLCEHTNATVFHQTKQNLSGREVVSYYYAISILYPTDIAQIYKEF